MLQQSQLWSEECASSSVWKYQMALFKFSISFNHSFLALANSFVENCLYIGRNVSADKPSKLCQCSGGCLFLADPDYTHTKTNTMNCAQCGTGHRSWCWSSSVVGVIWWYVIIIRSQEVVWKQTSAQIPPEIRENMTPRNYPQSLMKMKKSTIDCLRDLCKTRNETFHWELQTPNQKNNDQGL